MITVDRGLPQSSQRQVKRIDIWWRGQENGSLMLILAYLLTHNHEWANHTVRVLRIVPEGQDQRHATEELHSILYESRIKGAAVTVPLDGDLSNTLQTHSADADVVFLGLTPPRENKEEAFYQQYAALVSGLPTTMLVCSAGEADLLI